MEITFIGHSCFKIKGKDLTIVIDPYDPKKTGYKLPKLEADVVLSSHDHYDHNYIEGISGYTLLIDGPGEYETKETFIYGISTFHDNKEGADRGSNTMFHVEMDGFTVLHAGDLGHELSKETLEKISRVDILLIPIGGKYTIDAKTAVTPMHYQTKDLSGLSQELEPVEKFLEEMGVEGSAKKQDKLRITTRNEVPSETEVVILTPQH